MTYVLGIDKGTTATKTVVLRAETGEALATARRQTPVFHRHPDWHEEDMDLTFAAVAETIREAIAKAGIAPSEIAAIGVSGHMGGLWTLDAVGQPLGRAVAWPDARAAGLLAEWHADGRDEAMFEVCGNAPIPGLPLVLLSWLKSHEPERYAKISTVFCAKDYINFRLTGVIATDESDLSFFPCDIRKRCVSPELLALAGVPEIAHCLAPVLATGELVGRITAEAAALTGLAIGTPVVTGAGDAVAAAIGVGALAPGQAVTVIGTSFMNNLTIDAPLLEPRNVGFLFLMPGGRWQRLMSNTGGGSLCLDWALSAFGRVEFAADDPTIFARIEAEARKLPPVPDGLIVHPYFGTSGMTAPRHDPTARGSVFGLDMATSPISLIRSVMEGVAFSMVDCYAALSAPVTDIRLTGGGARSRLWCEICAAVMNRPLLLPEVEETGALGVAMLAAVHAGFHPDLATAALRMVRIADTVTPDPVWAARYAAAYPLFRALGRDLIPLWKHRAALLAPRLTQGTP
ncbi:MAG: carbohydrate kinase [Cypionkella sp.]|uniref:FGGY-family carbohydrate kinase n=1 Tax=Cypionkella sp. TaxID=2811411 RepID=UPI002635F5BC|nr:FGGY-family carbohydrate kinase [Cypionkella sp.]MDB5659686.1 carbohydrate kinase [Cypionkella sp.]